MSETTRRRPIPTLPPEAAVRLYDASKRVAYALAMETVDRLREDPGLVEAALDWRRRNPLAYAPDQEAWIRLLQGPVEVLCRELLRLDERGELLRDAKLSFGPIPDARLVAITAAAHRAHT